MLRRPEWIDYGDGVPGEAVLKILRKQKSAARFRRGPKDQTVPKTESVSSRQLSSIEENGARSLYDREVIAPTDDGRASLRRSPGFSHKHLKELRDNLRWQDHDTTGQRVEQFQRGLLHRGPIHAFGVNQNVGVQSQPH
jgi:hypothetical protein